MTIRDTAFCVCGLVFLTTASAQDIVIHNVTVVSPERTQPLPGADVVLDGDRIVKVAPHSSQAHRGVAKSMDGTGLYLVPGLIDSHVHLYEIPGMTTEQEKAHPDISRAARTQIPKSYLYFGFTTIVDLNSTPEEMANWNAHPLHPDTYFCGAAPIMDGYPMSFIPKPWRYQMKYFMIEPGSESLPAGVNAAEHTPAAVVARMKADGASCVKTHFERGFGGLGKLPVPSLEIIRDLVRAAHAVKLPVFLHANSAEAQTFGLAADVDIFAHGVWKWGNVGSTAELPSSITKILDSVIQTNKGWQPTIQVLYGERDLFNETFLSDPRLATAVPASLITWYRTEEGQWFHKELAKVAGVKPQDKSPDVDGLVIARVNKAVSYLAQRNARFLFGSDTPSDETYANPPGLNGRLEMQRLIDAGMTPAQVFRAATIANAEALGFANQIGTIEAGKRANLLLLHSSPIESIVAFDHIEKIVLRGKVLDPAELAANGK